MQEGSGGMWLQNLIVRFLKKQKNMFYLTSDDGVQASWQGRFFSIIPAKHPNSGILFACLHPHMYLYLNL
jgi:hypothetical protein